MFRRREKQFAALGAVLIAGLLWSDWAVGAAQNSLLWQTNLENAKQIAAQTNRLVLVHFWSPTCAACKQLEKNVYSLPQVQQTIQTRFVPVKINADDWPTTTKQYGITSLPTDLIITPSGQIIGRMISPQTPDAYVQQLAIAASGAAPIASPAGAAYASTVPMGTAAGVGMVSTNPAGGWMAAPSSVPSAYAPSATAPSTASAAVPNVGWGAATSSSSGTSTPAVPAYSDSRYTEYFQRFSAASTGTGAGISPGTNPVAAITPPAASPSAYTPPSYAPAAYASPTYSTPTVPAAAPSYAPPAAYGPQPTYGAPATSGVPVYGTPTYGAPANMPPAYAPQTNATVVGGPAATAAMSAPVAAPQSWLPGAQPQAAGAAVASSGGTAQPLALDGYCPVTLVEQQRWQLGDRRWGVIHRGRTYLFAGPEQQRKFLADPDHYSPAISGQDVVMALDYGQEVDGKRALGVEYQNRIYLFSTDASRQAFSQNPKRYAAEVLQVENPTQTTLR